MAALQHGNMKLGISPINWVNEDVPELGNHYTCDQLLRDMTRLGFSGTEMSRKFPQDAETLRQTLGTRGIQLVSQWKGVLFSDPVLQQSELDAYRTHVNFLKQMGCKQVVTCEIGKSPHADPRCTSKAVKADPLTEDEWKYMVDGLHQAGEICREQGMELVYHHHASTVIESPEQIERLLEMTDPQVVHLLYDTGHAYYGGGDPLKILQKYYDRIRHVHLKDVRSNVLDEVRRGKLDFKTAIVKGVFTTPGDGCIDFEPIIGELLDQGYIGWAIIEAEQDPNVANPYEYAEKAKKYLASVVSRYEQKMRIVSKNQ